MPEIELAGVISGLINPFEPIVRASKNHGNHGLRFRSHSGTLEAGIVAIQRKVDT